MVRYIYVVHVLDSWFWWVGWVKCFSLLLCHVDCQPIKNLSMKSSLIQKKKWFWFSDSENMKSSLILVLACTYFSPCMHHGGANYVTKSLVAQLHSEVFWWFSGWCTFGTFRLIMWFLSWADKSSIHCSVVYVPLERDWCCFQAVCGF